MRLRDWPGDAGMERGDVAVGFSLRDVVARGVSAPEGRSLQAAATSVRGEAPNAEGSDHGQVAAGFSLRDVVAKGVSTPEGRSLL